MPLIHHSALKQYDHAHHGPAWRRSDLIAIAGVIITIIAFLLSANKIITETRQMAISTKADVQEVKAIILRLDDRVVNQIRENEKRIRDLELQLSSYNPTNN